MTKYVPEWCNTLMYADEFGRQSGEYPLDDLSYRIRCDLHPGADPVRVTVADAEMLIRAQSYVMDCHALLAWYQMSWWARRYWWLHRLGCHHWCNGVIGCDKFSAVVRYTKPVTKRDAA